MTATLDGLNSTCFHTLRRLGAGEDVETSAYHRSDTLRLVRDELRRRGLVAEQKRGRKFYFTMTAMGRALLPAIEQHDVQMAAERVARASAEEAAEQLRNAAPALLAALQALMIACDDEGLSSEDDETFKAALDRQTAAIRAAQIIIVQATETP